MGEERQLMPGPQGRIPKLYEVEKGHKTESYIVAITGNPLTGKVLPPLCKPDKDSDDNEDGIVPSTSIEAEPLKDNEKKPLTEAKVLNQKDLDHYKKAFFWVRLRWFMLILLIIAVLAMIITSILIILFSPSCSPVNKPFAWKNAILYQVWTPSFQDSDGDGLGDLAGLQKRLEKLRKIDVSAIWVEPFLDSDNFSLAIRDHRSIDSRIGSVSIAESLIKEAHNQGLRIIISLPVSVTSDKHEWFLRSSRASKPLNANFSGFYHWRRTNSSSLDPSYYSEYNDTDISYLHYAGKPSWPILNWQNDTVREYMFEVFSYWIDKGIDGFHLSAIDYLARSPNGKQPKWSNVLDILRDIRNHVDTYSRESAAAKNKKIVLIAYRNDADEKDKENLSKNGLDSVVNHELGGIAVGSDACREESKIPDCTRDILSDILAFYNDRPEIVPMWQFGTPDLSRLASRLRSRQRAELLTMIQLMLPGINSFYYGEEIGMKDLLNDPLTPSQRGAMQWDTSKNAGFSSADVPLVNVHNDYVNINFERQLDEQFTQLKTFRTLAKLRSSDEAMTEGQIFIGKLVDSGFTVSRFLKRNDTAYGNFYVGTFNFGKDQVILQLADIPTLLKKYRTQGEVIAQSSYIDEASRYHSSIDVSSGAILLPPESGAILKFQE